MSKKSKKEDLFRLPEEAGKKSKKKHKRSGKKRKASGGFKTWFLWLLVALCLALAVRYIALDSVKVRTTAIDGYEPGDVVLVSLLGKTARRGDVVYLTLPGQSDACLRQVCAAAGDILVVSGGRLKVNGTDCGEAGALESGTVEEGMLLVLCEGSGTDNLVPILVSEECVRGKVLVRLFG